VRRIYFDHSATTPVHPQVAEEMYRFLTENNYGNPTSLHYFGRVARQAVEEAREKTARAIGAGDWWILRRHVLPNVAAPLLIASTLGLGSRIMQEASLSFLGLGVQPPAASWGSMVHHGLRWLGRAPWLVLFPGLAIAVGVLGSNLLGDGLRDLLDPRLKD